MKKEEFLSKLAEAVEIYKAQLHPGDEDCDTTWTAARAAVDVGLKAGPQTNWSARNSTTAHAVMLMAEGAECEFIERAQNDAYNEFYPQG